MYVWVLTCHCADVEDRRQLTEVSSFLSLRGVLGTEAQVIRRGGKYLHWLSHLSEPQVIAYLSSIFWGKRTSERLVFWIPLSKYLRLESP